ncbi:hypothetical protein EDB81DRAFT_795293 [Dactylonectria macrodidyma]|uniref:Uncharacterized protein n=1 Tax=Dactylonectria macrodidyma TaxID=307937 RepID=A0A9P9EWA0_9HYPO|nr:hypothetical protein EDB81DRAFT_795293 [Dactylonectria macrodidyma]
MPPDPTPPLPLAANRAALSNRISMLLASQSSVLKTMNLTRAPPSTSARLLTRPPDDDDADLMRGSRANEGVGYVPEAKDAPAIGTTREMRLLRGGKAAKAAKAARKGDGRSLRRDDSESEDEVGRSALGKRKRPPRAAESVVAAETVLLAEAGVEATKGDENGPVVLPVRGIAADEAVEDAVQDVKDGDEGAKKKRKKKNKKKKPKIATAQE